MSLLFYVQWRPKGRETGWKNVKEKHFYDIASESGYSEYEYKIIYNGKKISIKVIEPTTMNTEEKIKQKKIELSAFLENFNAIAKMLNSHKEESVRKYEDEIASLSKQEEQRPLTFLQLAEKHNPNLAKKLRNIDEGYSIAARFAEYITTTINISTEQARKFVAEIYLTLLAKEVNGETVIDWYNEDQIKIIPAYDYQTNTIKHYKVIETPANNIAFAGVDFFNKALDYSPEAKTMFNWYFGREEAK